MENIDVEAIMAEIKEEIDKRPYKEKILSFEDVGEFSDLDGDILTGYSFEELTRQVDNINAQYMVQEYRIFPSHGVLNKIKNIVKKLIRKPIRFYVNPIVHDQDEFNASVVKSINQIKFYISENEQLKQQVEELTREIEKLKGSDK